MDATYDKFRKMNGDNIMLSFKGEITSEIISMVLQIAENKLEAVDEKGSTKRKIFNILVECLQNLYHHAAIDTTNNKKTSQKIALLELWFENNYYYILTANYIKNENVANVKNKLDKINSLSKEELRDFYREILDNDQISEKGGAGLGMIDIARKSGEKLEYNINKVNDELSFIDFKVKIEKK